MTNKPSPDIAKWPRHERLHYVILDALAGGLRHLVKQGVVGVTGTTVASGHQEPDALVVEGSDGTLYDVFVQRRLAPDDPQGYKREQALNPVTFHPDNADPHLTLSRLHFGLSGRGPLTKRITAVMYREHNTDIIGYTVLDEDLVIRGLRLLFPHGELSGGAEQVCRALIEWWSGFDADTVADHEFLQDVEEIVAMAQTTLGLKS